VPTWTDLCDPDEQTLRAALPPGVHDVTIDRIMSSGREAEPRTRLEARGSYVFGVLAYPVLTDDSAVFQEVDVIATLDAFVTVRKTPEGHMACDISATKDAAQRSSDMVGMWLHSLIDDIAERFLDVVDTFDEQIDDLEDHVHRVDLATDPLGDQRDPAQPPAPAPRPLADARRRARGSRRSRRDRR
jgi:Mg2+ and Co2+ transporter CorA